MNQCRMELFSKKIGEKYIPPGNSSNAIRLSPREREILYYLSYNKSAKEIANILSILEKKAISHLTIHSIINKQLYVKFDVMSISELIEKAHSYGIIPFIWCYFVIRFMYS